MKLLVNKIECLTCGQVLESRHRHDFASCECGTFTDGGTEYSRRSLDCKDLCVYDDGGHEKRREHLEWGSFGKDGKGPKRLIKIKDMDDSHLLAIKSDIDNGAPYGMGIHLETILAEIEYRSLR